MTVSEVFAPATHKKESPVIHEGFGAGIAALNRRLVSPNMRTLGDGRAYLLKSKVEKTQPPFYVAQIHARMVFEKEISKLPEMLAEHQHEFTGRIYMGAAGLINLSYMAAMKPAAAILFDLNPLQTLWWRHILKGLAAYSDPLDFGQYLVDSRTALDRDFYNLLGPYRLLTDRWCRVPEESWHALRTPVIRWGEKLDDIWTDDRPDVWWLHNGYEHLHAMARADSIGALTLDVLDPVGWKDLRDWLDHQLPLSDGFTRRVGMIYISNIFLHLHGHMDWSNCEREGARPEFARSVIEQVLDPAGAAIIDDEAHPGLHWRMDRQDIRRSAGLRDVWGLRPKPKTDLPFLDALARLVPRLGIRHP